MMSTLCKSKTLRSTVRYISVLFIVMPAALAFGADVFEGREIYATHCESCHGANGRSDDPGIPDFSRGERLFVPDSELFRKVRSGEGAMPAYRDMLSDDDIRDVIAYLRSLRQ